MTRSIALYRAPAGTMLRTFQPARDLLSDWRARDPAVVDAALEVLAQSKWHEDKAICARVREEREYAADLIFAEPGVPGVDRFPSLAPPYPEPDVPRGWARLTFWEAVDLGLVALGALGLAWSALMLIVLAAHWLAGAL